jgi:hypothetical protein
MNISPKNAVKQSIAASLILGLTTATLLPALANPRPAQAEQKVAAITAFQPKTADEKAIVTLMAARDKRYPAEQPMIITGLVVSDNYGLSSQVFGETGGQTVMKKGKDGAWTIVRGSGGVQDVEILQKWGVPKAIAQDLTQKMQAQFLANNPRPAQPTPLEQMIPSGWTLEKQSSGDLNGDRQPDMALKLIQSTTGQRALLVLLATPSGWEKLALAPKLLLCKRCAGMMGTETGEHIIVNINNGVLVVEHYRGSRDAIHLTQRFWIDRNSQKLVCIGEDINPYDRANGNKLNDSRNFLTGKRIVETILVNTRDGHKPRRSTEELKVSKVLRSIESMDIEVATQSSLPVPID